MVVVIPTNVSHGTRRCLWMSASSPMGQVNVTRIARPAVISLHEIHTTGMGRTSHPQRKLDGIDPQGPAPVCQGGSLWKFGVADAQGQADPRRGVFPIGYIVCLATKQDDSHRGRTIDGRQDPEGNVPIRGSADISCQCRPEERTD